MKKKILLVFLCLITSIQLVKGAEKEYQTYAQGTEVNVYLNANNDTKAFYVLTDEGKNSDTITLFMKEYVGVSKFYEDLSVSEDHPCTYETSDLKKNLESMTASWTNAIERRLITYDELLSIDGVFLSPTGLTYYVSSDSMAFCKTSGDNSVGPNANCYWTMSTDESADNQIYLVAAGIPNVYSGNGYIRSDSCTVMDNDVTIDELDTEDDSFGGLYVKPVIKIKKEYIVDYSDPSSDSENTLTDNQQTNTDNQQTNTDTNPETGVTYILIVLLLLVIALIGVIYFYNKRKQKEQ